MTKSNDSAFPLTDPDIPFQPGLTVREYFAAKAFQALITTDKAWISNEGHAQIAVKLADALIEELNKTKQP
jgi:hypothetical protein